MKSLVLLPVVLLVVLGCNTKQNPVSANETGNRGLAKTAATGWNSLTQSQKDLTIFSAALSYVGQPNNNCKVFVSTVVTNASGGVVTIPGTADKPYQYMWKTPLPLGVVNRNITDIANVGFMDIIQMYYYPGATFGWTQHTAIVVSKTSTQMTWVDANFKKNAAGVMVVATHDVTFSQFRSWSPSGAGFTVYHVR
ncbi:MAG: hypothetical protein PHO56_00440 [Patescibacteria group bacterium]|nr:hypothetical protein [Patescibacteria group bacterium]